MPYTFTSGVDEWYANCPLGTMDDVDVKAEERRMHELMSLDMLTPDECSELDRLMDQFVHEVVG